METQVLVPAAGRGSRFVEAGYTDPKPLIRIAGRPLIKWSTDGIIGLEHKQFTFLVQQDHVVEHNIDQELVDLYGPVNVIPLSSVTDGAACTALLAKDSLDAEAPLVITNCDNLFRIDIGRAQRVAAFGDAEAALFYIAGDNPAWSFVELGQENLVKRVAEKEVISDRAVVGCFYWHKAKYFVEAAEEMIERNLRINNEFYIAPTFNLMIEQGRRVRAYPCELHYSLGTPEEVTSFTDIFFPARASALARA